MDSRNDYDADYLFLTFRINDLSSSRPLAQTIWQATTGAVLSVPPDMIIVVVNVVLESDTFVNPVGTVHVEVEIVVALSASQSVQSKA
jgi:hypothetical protein